MSLGAVILDTALASTSSGDSGASKVGAPAVGDIEAQPLDTFLNALKTQVDAKLTAIPDLYGTAPGSFDVASLTIDKQGRVSAISSAPDATNTTRGLTTLSQPGTHVALAQNDPVTTNARTPTAHKTTHTTGGSDALTPTDIGALPATDPSVTNARTPTAHKTTHATGNSDALAPSDIGAPPASRSISTTSPLAGGGDLSVSRTLSIPAATSTVNGYMSSTDKGKLDGIEAGARDNTVLVTSFITPTTSDLSASGGTSIAANTWITLPSISVSFSVSSTTSLIWIEVTGGISAGSTTGLGLAAVVDGVTGSRTKISGGVSTLFLKGTAKGRLTGLTAASHTLTLQIYSLAANTWFLRTQSGADYEFVRIEIYEMKQ